MRPLPAMLALACSSLAACGPTPPLEEPDDGGSTTTTTTDAASSSESSTTAAVDETGTTTEDEPPPPPLARRHVLQDDQPCGTAAAGDLDGDGIDDLFVAPGDDAVLLAFATPRTIHSYLGGGDPLLDDPELHCCLDIVLAHDSVLVDIDGDGRHDPLVVADMDHHSGDVVWMFETIQLLVRAPEGGYLPSSIVSGASWLSLPTRAAAGTWRPDATAVAIAREQELALFLADGPLLVEPPPEAFVPLPDLVHDLGAVDFDGDGLDDVVALLNDGVVLVPNPGDGTLSAPIESMPPWQGTTLLVGELDGVPPADLVLPDDSGLAVGLMSPSGPQWQWHELPVPNTATLADVDGDGALDLVTVTNEELVAHLGGGDGTFDPNAITLSPGAGAEPETIVAADFDGNGTPELALCDELGVLVVQTMP